MKLFSRLDIDLKFTSSSELPEFVRKNFFFSKKIQKMNAEEKKLPDDMDSTLNVILETVDADIDLYFTISNFVAFTASGHAPGLS